MIAHRDSKSSDYTWNTIGVLLQNAVSPVLLAVVARVNGAYDAGVFAFAFAVALVGAAVSLWGGRSYQVSDARGEFSEQSYVASRLLLAVIVGVGVVAFCLVNGYDTPKTLLISALTGFKLIESVADPLYGVLQRRGALYRSGVSLTIKATVGVGAFVIVDMVTHSMLASTVALLVVNLCVTCTYDAWWVRQLTPTLSLRGIRQTHMSQLRTLLTRTLPAVTVSVLTILTLMIPRYYVDRFHHDQNVYFGIIAMPLTAMLLIVLFVLQPNFVRLTELYAQDKFESFRAAVRRVVWLVGAGSVAIFFVTMLFGTWILKLLFGVDVSTHYESLVVVTAAGVANALVATYVAVLTIVRRFGAQVSVLIVTNLSVAAAGLGMTASGGIVAGAYIYLGACVIQSVLLMIAYYTAMRGGSDAAKA